MAVNNEIGTIADIEKIGEIAHAHNVNFIQMHLKQLVIFQLM